MTDRTLIVIGAGPGGYVAAIEAAHQGIKTTLIERDQLGGTCLNRGCIPTKTLLHTAELFADVQNAQDVGLCAHGVSVDYEVLKNRVEKVITGLQGGIAGLMSANDIEVLHGNARILGSGQVELTTTENTVQTLHADHIIVAVGSRPALPPIPGIDQAGVLTSDTLLETIPKLSSLIIIGGGVIGMEFASLYTALQTPVTVLEAMGRILPTLDKEIGQSLALTMKKRGCAITTTAFVQAIETSDDGKLCVRYTHKDKELVACADAVLVATGRASNTENLFDDTCTPALDRGRLVVDEHMATSIPGIYAIGDAAATPFQLAHAASAQGIVAVRALAQVPCDINLTLIPACVYTSPEIASVGLDEAQAREANIDVVVGKFSLAGNGKSIITCQDRSFVKIIADSQNRIIGAQLMCGRATDIISELTLAISNTLSVDQLGSIVRPHPTFEEALGEATESLTGHAIHVAPKN